MDLGAARKKADLAKAAAADIDQAGRGLALVMQHCTTGTVDLKTAQITSVCLAYISSALGALLEAVAGDEIAEAQKPGTGIIV